MIKTIEGRGGVHADGIECVAYCAGLMMMLCFYH